MMSSVNFFTFKWGTKYGSEYVNRLYNSLKIHYHGKFKMFCITDDFEGIDKDIYYINYNNWDEFNYSKDRVFTREKLILFDKFSFGKNVWLDLDILIHDNITDMLNVKSSKPVFIWNHWNPLSKSYDWYGKGSSCHVNSSVVMWEGKNGLPVLELLRDKKEEAFFTYKSLDKFLFYQCHRKGMLEYWKKDLISNYNRESFIKKGNISIFNTSHLINNKGIKEIAFELDEAEGWAKEIWTSYS